MLQEEQWNKDKMGPRLCWYRGREEGREDRGEGRREPRRAEERKSIQNQRESDKPEQCIVQTHSITQSHVEALTNTDTQARTHPGRYTHTHTCSFRRIINPTKHRSFYIQMTSQPWRMCWCEQKALVTTAACALCLLGDALKIWWFCSQKKNFCIPALNLCLKWWERGSISDPSWGPYSILTDVFEDVRRDTWDMRRVWGPER